MTTDDPVRRALSALAEADRGRHAPPDVERALLEAFDHSEQKGHAVRHPVVAWTVRLAAVAAALFLTMSGLIYVLGRNRSATPRADQSVGAPAHDVAAAHDEVLRPSRSSPAPPVAARGDRQGPRLNHGQAIVHRRKTGRDANLTVSSNGESDDVVRVVRMRLPRASLQLLGIPTIDPDAVGTTEVELLVGEDGLARTIRMVR
jgi:hypothetical protein